MHAPLGPTCEQPSPVAFQEATRGTVVAACHLAAFHHLVSHFCHPQGTNRHRHSSLTLHPSRPGGLTHAAHGTGSTGL